MYFFAPKMIIFSHKNSQQRDGQSLPSLHNLWIVLQPEESKKKEPFFTGMQHTPTVRFRPQYNFQGKDFPHQKQHR